MVAILGDEARDPADDTVLVGDEVLMSGGTTINGSVMLGAGDNDAYGIGFGYECGTGGWLRWDTNLDKPLGEPAAPAQNVSNIWTRSFKSGVKVYMNATPVVSVGARLATCITWADGSETARAELAEICDNVLKQLYVEAFSTWGSAGGLGKKKSRGVAKIAPPEKRKLVALAAQLGLELITVQQKFENKRQEMNAYLKAQCLNS